MQGSARQETVSGCMLPRVGVFCSGGLCNGLLDLLSLVLGAITFLAFPPFNHVLLAPAALAALFAIWHVSSSQRAGWRGFLFGVGLYGIGLYWLILVVLSVDTGYMPVLASILAIILLMIMGNPGVTGYLWRRLHDRLVSPWMLLAIPAIKPQ